MTRLHRRAVAVAGATLAVVASGGLVTSTGSGLAVSDWPSSYGSSVFTFPLSRWMGGLLFQHAHRLLAIAVGLLTLALAVSVWRKDTRSWVKGAGLAVVVVLAVQGLLGGLAVVLLQPPPISVAHAGVAPLLFAMTVALAQATSRGWIAGYDGSTAATAARDGRLRRLLLATPFVVFMQILLGAIMRHTGAALAIPDLPLAFDGPLPLGLLADPGVTVHVTHRVVALVAAGFVAASAWHLWSRHRIATYLVHPAMLALALALVEIALGAATVLTGRGVLVSTAHAVAGALTFAATVVVAMRSYRAAAGIPLAAPMPAPQGARG